MKFGRTEMISAGLLLVVMLTIGGFAINQAFQKTNAKMEVFVGVDRSPQAFASSPLKFAAEHVSNSTVQSALGNQLAKPLADMLGYHEGLTLTELRNDFEAFEQVDNALATLERPLQSSHEQLHPHAADLLARAEDVFNEAYNRSGEILEMNAEMGRSFLTLENALREDADINHVLELYKTTKQRYELALQNSDKILHKYTAQHTQALMEELRKDLNQGNRSTTHVLADLDDIYSDLLRQYNDEQGHALGFTTLSDHLQSVRSSLRNGDVVDEARLEGLFRELDIFFTDDTTNNG